MKKLIGDFKAFINKGNIAELAIAVVIGGAFGKIVSSFVANILNPLIGLIIGRIHLDDLKIVLRAADEAAEITELSLSYGVFLQSLMDFLIIALSIFLALRLFKRLTSEAKKHAKETKKQIRERIAVLTDGNKQHKNAPAVIAATISDAQTAKDGNLPDAAPKDTSDIQPATAETVPENTFTKEELTESTLLLREIRDILKQSER